MTEPQHNTPLTADDVKLLRKGDWLLRFGKLCAADGTPSPYAEHIMAADEEGIVFSARAKSFTFLGRPDQSGWIPHDGGENPAPGLRVDYRMDNGHEGNGWLSDNLDWQRESQVNVITHWRPHAPAPAGEGRDV